MKKNKNKNHTISCKHPNRPCKRGLIKLSQTSSRAFHDDYSNSKLCIPDLPLQFLPRNSLLIFASHFSIPSMTSDLRHARKNKDNI